MISGPAVTTNQISPFRLATRGWIPRVAIANNKCERHGASRILLSRLIGRRLPHLTSRLPAAAHRPPACPAPARLLVLIAYTFRAALLPPDPRRPPHPRRDASEYIFFRNHYPSRDKLEAQLRARPGACSYCCQCAWVTVPAAGAAGAGGLVLIRRRLGGGAAPTPAEALHLPLPPASGASPAGDAAQCVRVGGGGWACWTCSGHR